MTIEAVGSYSVDWGDGTVSGPYADEGRAWPDGSIQHRYERVGRYDVAVIQDWGATWSVGDDDGYLDGLFTTTVMADFKVDQIQAVGVAVPAG